MIHTNQSQGIVMGYYSIPKNPYISPISTMGTLLGVHPIVPWQSLNPHYLLYKVFNFPGAPGQISDPSTGGKGECLGERWQVNLQ